MNIRNVGETVRVRREQIGLTQGRLAKLANLSRQTIHQLEAGTINDLGFDRVMRVLGVLGLSLDRISTAARDKKRGLWMAARTSSVSYADDLTEDALEHALATGEAPAGFEAHIGHLLDEVPLEVVVMAVEEAAKQEHRPPVEIWRNVAALALKHSDSRRELWV
ncbi:helix-turn-helix transcriptional regulator [Paraburkholderia phosphatilytica]|uniref:helix-turn-helix transcriptional regulator n=1 Tax=Paraburkholderia phosphatilytica TaxID=2282883 RepID=UPI000E485F0E|nr:helix-turn-helix transcriptional regulator [Paraburkholderia phosphatilytica]